MPARHRLVAVTGASLAAVGSLGGVAAATTHVRAATRLHRAAPNAAALLVQKLEANQRYPYTQFTLALPKLTGKGITAADSAVATGIRIVVDAPKPTKAVAQSAQVALFYKTTALGELRVIKNNLYLLLNVAKFTTLPLKFSASTKQQLSTVDTVFGERWFELPVTTLGQLAHSKSGASLNSGLKAVQDPLAVQTTAEASLAKMIAALPVTRSAAPGGNQTFRSAGTLQSLASKAGSVISAIDKSALGSAAKPVTSLGKAKGTYSAVFTTADHGAFVNHILLAVGAAGQGSINFSISYAHAIQPVVAPKGAKVLTKQSLAQFGL